VQNNGMPMYEHILSYCRVIQLSSTKLFVGVAEISEYPVALMLFYPFMAGLPAGLTPTEHSCW